MLRVSLVLIFLSIGLQKFTAYEAAAIEPFVGNSPLLSWAYDLFGLRATAGMIGVLELAVGLGLATGLFARGSLPSLLGAIGLALTYVVTLSFLLTAPGVIAWSEGLPLSSAYPGQFLVKDMVPGEWQKPGGTTPRAGLPAGRSVRPAPRP